MALLVFNSTELQNSTETVNTLTPITIAILTPIPLEYTAVEIFLEETHKESRDNISYTIGFFKASHGKYRIILRETGSRNSDVALATERIIHHFKPVIIILTGIAGGVKDVKIGDIVVGTKAYGYEAGKSTDEGFMSRPNVLPYSTSLLEAAKSIARNSNWQTRIKNLQLSPTTYFGPIASGDQVVASTQSEIYQRIKKHYNDTLALEMESIGFATAVLPYQNIHTINIRGISDLLDDKNAAHDKKYQAVATAHAAAFVFELIYQLNPTQFIMDTKTIAKQVVSILFPLLNLDSVKEIGKEFKEATDGSVRELWEKVKPVFIEEIEVEENLEEQQVAIRTSLRKEMKDNNQFKQDLESILKSLIMKETEGSGVNITNSKNVVQGSNISVGGDFRIGDD